MDDCSLFVLLLICLVLCFGLCLFGLGWEDCGASWFIWCFGVLVWVLFGYLICRFDYGLVVICITFCFGYVACFCGLDLLFDFVLEWFWLGILGFWCFWCVCCF